MGAEWRSYGKENLGRANPKFPTAAVVDLSIRLSLGRMVANEDADLSGGPKRPQTCPDTLGWTNGASGEPVTPQLQTCARWARMTGMRYMTVRVAHVVLERVQTGASVYSKRLARNASRPFTSIHDGFAVRKLNQKPALCGKGLILKVFETSRQSGDLPNEQICSGWPSSGRFRHSDGSTTLVGEGKDKLFSVRETLAGCKQLV